MGYLLSICFMLPCAELNISFFEYALAQTQTGERFILSKLNKQNTCNNTCSCPLGHIFLRKEVIQPHLPIRLPCYDFTPIICPTLGGWLLAVTPPTSGVTNSRGVTGGVYKARERIHRGMLIRDY